MNSFGHLLRITTFGESHGPMLGVVLDGLPAGLLVNQEAVQIALDRRRPGQSRLTTPRREADAARFVSGLFEGRTTGAPVTILFENHDVDSSKYEDLRDLYRPSHADFTFAAKWGHRDWRGGARASARETVARVAAGAIAEQVLVERYGVNIVSWVSDVAHLGSAVDPATVSRDTVDASLVRCPDPLASEAMIAHIDAIRRQKDSVGGCVRAVVRGVPAGWGEPVFDKLEAKLAQAMLSLPASKGFEVGSGFAGTLLTGSQHNDPFVMETGRVATQTNHSGGIQGGISNGESILFRVAFKPVATIFQPQQTVTTDGTATTFTARGRHDPCVLPRAVPIVEAMTALVLLDAAMRQGVWAG